jgi:hypothetical protein
LHCQRSKKKALKRAEKLYFYCFFVNCDAVC